MRPFKQVFRDTSGQFAVFWALSMSSVLAACGAAYDITIAQTAKQKAQNIADSIALTAAIQLRDNGQVVPTTDAKGYVDGHAYNLNALGLSISPYIKTTKGGNTDNWITVTYDQTNKQLTATVTGKTITPFMSMFGHDFVPLSASSTVKYDQQDLNNSLSLALVLDTSGSMFYYDETGTKREDAMETASLDMMHNLTSLVAGQETDGRILRTGIIPYYSQIWWSKVVNMKWGAVSDYSISSLYEGGGTNSGSSMWLADQWMAGETAYHKAETGRDHPKKYVILMTDGANNYASYDTNTLAACDSLKAQGVIIYTIGYALNHQTYGSPNYWDTYTPPQWEIDRATALLSGCASGPEYFKTTDNSTDLNQIFQGIGADIAQNFLRIAH